MVSGIILASGFSRRMGREKLLMRLADETPLLEKVIQSAVASSLSELILVYRHEGVKDIGASYDLITVENPDAGRGQSAAVSRGISAASDDAEAFLFMVGDQPFLTAATINRIIAFSGKHPGQIIVPTYDDRRGNPVLFPASFKNDLMRIRGDQGGRQVVKAAPDRVITLAITPAYIGYDVDTLEDYQKIKQQLWVKNNRI